MSRTPRIAYRVPASPGITRYDTARAPLGLGSDAARRRLLALFACCSSLPLARATRPCGVEHAPPQYTPGRDLPCGGAPCNHPLTQPAPSSTQRPLSLGAQRNTGAVVCWGNNFHGQLGDGTLSASVTPVTVSGLADARGVSAALFNTCAVRKGGAVLCWGGNVYEVYGQPGGGTARLNLTPAMVPGLFDATFVSAGIFHACAVRATGAVLCWGRNATGQLGDGTTHPSLTPVTVAGVSDATSVSAGGSSTCAIRKNGVLLCWGGI